MLRQVCLWTQRVVTKADCEVAHIEFRALGDYNENLYLKFMFFQKTRKNTFQKKCVGVFNRIVDYGVSEVKQRCVCFVTNKFSNMCVFSLETFFCALRACVCLCVVLFVSVFLPRCY